MAAVVCSWSCLGSNTQGSHQQSSLNNSISNLNLHSTSNQFLPNIQNPISIPNPPTNQPRGSYAERIRGQQPTQIDVASLPSPVLIGGIPTVTLSREVVERGSNFCQFALIGRVNFNQVSLKRLRSIATELWVPTGEWKIIPLGRGFFMLKLHSKDDFIRIWSQAWKIGEQVLHFMKWNPDFDTEKQKTSNALVWVQFPKLGQQYWDYEALMTIGKGIGTPIGVDKQTLSRETGFYASVLIDIDMSLPIPSTVNVKEEDGKQFSQEVFIPKIPQFCSHCNSVGHNMYDCRNLMRAIQATGGNSRGNVGQAGNGDQRRVMPTPPSTELQTQRLPVQSAHQTASSTELQTHRLPIQSAHQTASIKNTTNPIPITQSTHTPAINTNISPQGITVPLVDQTTVCQNSTNTVTPATVIGHQVDPRNDMQVIPTSAQIISISGTQQTQIEQRRSGEVLRDMQDQTAAQMVEVTNSRSTTQLVNRSREDTEYVKEVEPVTQGERVIQEDAETVSVIGVTIIGQESNKIIDIPVSLEEDSVNGGSGVSTNGVAPAPVAAEAIYKLTDTVAEPKEAEIVREDNAGNTEPVEEPHTRANQPLPVFNAFQLLSESDPIPESMKGIMKEVDMVTQRMDEFLNPAKGTSTSTTSKSRNLVQAFSLGPRRSKRFR